MCVSVLNYSLAAVAICIWRTSRSLVELFGEVSLKNLEYFAMVTDELKEQFPARIQVDKGPAGSTFSLS